MEAFDLNGNLFELDLDDLPARVVLHEHDHLDGVMFPARMTATERRKIDAKLADFEHDFRRAQKAGEIEGDRALLAKMEAFRL